MFQTESNELVGRRVRLVRCDDPYTTLRSGDEGTVTLVDDYGTVHVKWDNGSTLGLVEEAGDRFSVIRD